MFELKVMKKKKSQSADRWVTAGAVVALEINLTKFRTSAAKFLAFFMMVLPTF